MICFSNLLVLIYRAQAPQRKLYRASKAMPRLHQQLCQRGLDSCVFHHCLGSGSPACFQHSNGIQKALHLPFSPVSWWRSSDCPWAFPVHFRVTTEHWALNKTEIWQQKLSIIPVISSLLSTVSYSVSGRAAKSEAALENLKFTALCGEGNWNQC